MVKDENKKAYNKKMKAFGKLIKKYPKIMTVELEDKLSEYYAWKNLRSARVGMMYSIFSLAFACIALILNIVNVIIKLI